MCQPLVDRWFAALEQRHLASLSFSEVRRAVQALSSLYVERREGINRGSAFSGAGKRAAFALYYSPLHFLLVREVVRALDARVPENVSILDLGCGTGVAGAAWALESKGQPSVVGVDRNSWTLQECRWTYGQLGIKGRATQAEISAVRIPAATAVIAAFAINELDPASRERLRGDFVKIAGKGAPVLIIEPIARRLTSWWDEWSSDWKSLGGRNDEWRFRIDLPGGLALMDKAAGLHHRELTGRSLWLPPIA